MSISFGQIRIKPDIKGVKPYFCGEVKPSVIQDKLIEQPELKPVRADQALVYFTARKNVSLEDLPGQVDRSNLKKHINYLASEDLAGRLPDTEGIEKAKNYIVNEFKAAGLKPFKPLADENYQQSVLFEVVYHERFKKKNGLYTADLNRSDDAIIVEDKGLRINNLLGYIPAKVKTDKYVILMAHYDHIGRNVDTGKVYPGADDNASGVAALLEIARILGQSRYDKNIIFAATSGEEIKCLGSKFLARELNRKGFEGKVEVLNMDCLGANGKFAVIEGWEGEKNQRLYKTASKAAKDLKIPVKKEDFETNSNTDAAAMDQAGFPAVSLVWAYDHEHNNRKHFHEPADKPEIVNYDGVEKSTKLALATMFDLAKNSPE